MHNFDSIPLDVTYLTPSAAEPKNPQEVIAANVELLIAQFEGGDTKGLTAYLLAMGHFRQFSFSNILEIARQRPSSTRVAEESAWQQLGREVTEGQNGIRILIPIAEEKGGATDPNQAASFRAVHVFDVAQTEGAELPKLSERVTGDAGESRGRLVEFITRQGIELGLGDSVDASSAISCGGQIASMPDQDPAEEFSTLVHELALAMLRNDKTRTESIKRVQASEAEAVTFVVCQTIGIDAGRASPVWTRRQR